MGNPTTHSPINTCTVLRASGDRRDDGDLVAVLHGGRIALQEPDVFLIHEDVHEAPQLALRVADALLDAGVAPLEIGEELCHRLAVTLHLRLPAGQALQGRGNPYR